MKTPSTKTKVKKSNHYVDNQKFYNEIVEYKKKVEIAKENGLEKPRLSEYIGKCIFLIAENLARRPRYMNYSFVEEMKSDAIENSLRYFDNFDTTKYDNPFAYFTQITNYAFLRRIKDEEKKRYVIYKKFQESILDTADASLMVDMDDNHLITSQMYDNLNVFIKNFEDKEKVKKEKRKSVREGLEKFVGDDDNEQGTESV